MIRRTTIAAAPILCALLGQAALQAQRGTGDWMTSGSDAQRSSWIRVDGKISPQSMAKKGFDLVWSIPFNNAPRQLNSIGSPALLDFYIGYKGFRTLGFYGGSSNRIMVVDTDLGRMEWEKSFAVADSAASSQSSLPCPGGITSAVTRPTGTAYPLATPTRGMGRGSPAKSGVGEPYAGAITLIARQAQRPAPTPPPRRPATGGAAAAAAFNPFAPRIQWIMALAGDGKLHSAYVSNGLEPVDAIPFLPAGANAQGLIVIDNVAYAATTNGCGGAEDGVWALDMVSKKVTQWKSSAKGVAGTAGPAIGPDGTLYVASGSELTALAPKTLAPKGSAKVSGTEFTSSPVVFEEAGKDLIAVAAADGRIYLFDSSNLGSAEPLAKSTVFSTPNYPVGTLTSWKDATGERWVLAPAGGSTATKAGFPVRFGGIEHGALVAYKVVNRADEFRLIPGWVSRDLVSPMPPLVINGVVFVVSSGEFLPSDASVSAEERIRKSGKAILYALDGTTGNELWNSGNKIKSFVHSGGLAAGGSRVYVSDFTGTQYAFGFPTEH